jgi:predicted RNA-binding Zn-ribbon protein involved in translation (DUF1610 family)
MKCPKCGKETVRTENEWSIVYECKTCDEGIVIFK